MTLMIDKKRVADSFSKAATTYDSVAALQREIGHELFQDFKAALSQAPAQCLDLGCGTGYFTEYLHQQCPTLTLTALDIAPGMLEYAQQTRDCAGVEWVCADAEQLPFAVNQFDHIFSSLAIQWCEQSDALFSGIHRVLRQGGTAFIATLGPATLHELRQAWQQVDQYQHVNRFQSLETLKGALPEGLLLEHAVTTHKVLQYAQLKELTQELKYLGAHNMNAGAGKGLTGRARIKAFRNAYETWRTDAGYLPATYEVYYLVLRKQ